MTRPDRKESGLPAYYTPGKTWTLTCACRDSVWIDAGCVFHGVQSMVGMWDGEVEAVRMREALMPGKRPGKFS